MAGWLMTGRPTDCLSLSPLCLCLPNNWLTILSTKWLTDQQIARLMNRQEAFSWAISAVFTAHILIFFPSRICCSTFFNLSKHCVMKHYQMKKKSSPKTQLTVFSKTVSKVRLLSHHRQHKVNIHKRIWIIYTETFHVKAICKWCWRWLLPMMYSVMLAHYPWELEKSTLRLADSVLILLIVFESENLKEMGHLIIMIIYACVSLVLDVEQMKLSTTAVKDTEEVQKWKEIPFLYF